jgi:hypothetical protein
MLCFETLNPTIESCKSTSYDDELEDEGNVFGVGASFEESFQTLVNKESTLLGGYPYPLLHVKILLFCGTTTKGSFPMWQF